MDLAAAEQAASATVSMPMAATRNLRRDSIGTRW
jgi:hypothetical protein